MSDSGASSAQQTAKRAVLEASAVVLDVREIERQAAFWGAVIGEEPGPLRGEGKWLTVGSLGPTTHLTLQKVPETKVAKNRCHLDFFVPDVERAVSEIVALGGTRLGEPRPGGGVTMADPEGNEFCIGAFRRTKAGKRTNYGYGSTCHPHT